MAQNPFAEANRRLHEAFALLDVWIRQMTPPGPNATIHDRAVVVRECVRQALDRMGDLEDAIRLHEQQP